jgi:lambda family phage portal protein
MNPFKYIRGLFSKKGKVEQRNYREAISLGGVNSDWSTIGGSEDQAVWTNAYLLTARTRSLAQTNPTFCRYRELIWGSVFGDAGTMLRMKVKENEDRVIHTAGEKAVIEAYQRRRDRVRKWAEAKDETGRLRAINFERDYGHLEYFGTNGSRVAQVKVGEPDVFANLLIERKWKEWQRAEFCDVRKTRTYAQIRQLRLWSAIRDGDFFIRLVRGKSVNKFGFSLQLLNAEWVDRFYNDTMENGDEVRMGIRYKMNSWGLGEPVSYFFIKRQPKDWQFSVPGAFNFYGGAMHDEIPASEIIHYARPIDAESTRPAPWVASCIPVARQLSQYAIAEVIAARAQACKVGWLSSTVVPEGGVPTDVDPRTGVPRQELTPGSIVGLPWGVEYTESDPKHPNGNFENFRKAMLREQSAGMPGAAYPELSSDYESINFSAGRLQRLATDSMTYMIQRFDIDDAETPIFEAWLEMALMTRQIPLPAAKYDKFNAPHFQGPRTPGVDEIKQVTAAALRVANNFSSDQKECDLISVDFETNLFEQAEANMLKEMLGLPTMKTVEKPGVASQVTPDDEGDGDGSDDETVKPAAKPAKKKSMTKSKRVKLIQ